MGESFIGADSCAMILGDNIFYGNRFTEMLKNAARKADEGYATIFGYYVDNPEGFGIVEFDQDGSVLSIEEKPKQPKSKYAVTGLYFYPEGVAEKAKMVRPSERGELEITELNNIYLREGSLQTQIMGRGFTWLDTGTMENLLEASEFVHMIQKRQSIMISAPEEIGYRNGWIDAQTLLEAAVRYGKSSYGKHLRMVAQGNIISVC